jgi:integrase
MLKNDLQRHADLHWALGFKFRTQHALLRLFVAHAEKLGDEFIKARRVIDWATQAPSPAQRRNRLLTVRRFALALRAEDPGHEVPSDNVFGHPERRRRKPYIYSSEEIAKLLAAATQLAPAGSIKPLTYETLFGLLAATGMRISAALALRLSDVTADGLLIRTTKFQKSRLLPLHSTTRAAIERYLKIRSGVEPTNDCLFISANLGPLPYDTAAGVFRRLACAVGIRGGPGEPGARIHDLRHTFAVRSLENCAGDRRVIERHLVALSTYLGHARVIDTYWYLEATPVLLKDVAVAGEMLLRGTQG